MPSKSAASVSDAIHNESKKVNEAYGDRVFLTVDTEDLESMHEKVQEDIENTRSYTASRRSSSVYSAFGNA